MAGGKVRKITGFTSFHEPGS